MQQKTYSEQAADFFNILQNMKFEACLSMAYPLINCQQTAPAIEKAIHNFLSHFLVYHPECQSVLDQLQRKFPNLLSTEELKKKANIAWALSQIYKELATTSHPGKQLIILENIVMSTRSNHLKYIQSICYIQNYLMIANLEDPKVDKNRNFRETMLRLVFPDECFKKISLPIEDYNREVTALTQQSTSEYFLSSEQTIALIKNIKFILKMALTPEQKATHFQTAIICFLSDPKLDLQQNQKLINLLTTKQLLGPTELQCLAARQQEMIDEKIVNNWMNDLGASPTLLPKPQTYTESLNRFLYRLLILPIPQICDAIIGPLSSLRGQDKSKVDKAISMFLSKPLIYHSECRPVLDSLKEYPYLLTPENDTAITTAITLNQLYVLFSEYNKTFSVGRGDHSKTLGLNIQKIVTSEDSPSVKYLQCVHCIQRFMEITAVPALENQNRGLRDRLTQANLSNLHNSEYYQALQKENLSNSQHNGLPEFGKNSIHNINESQAEAIAEEYAKKIYPPYETTKMPITTYIARAQMFIGKHLTYLHSASEKGLLIDMQAILLASFKEQEMMCFIMKYMYAHSVSLGIGHPLVTGLIQAELITSEKLNSCMENDLTKVTQILSFYQECRKIDFSNVHSAIKPVFDACLKSDLSGIQQAISTYLSSLIYDSKFQPLITLLMKSPISTESHQKQIKCIVLDKLDSLLTKFIQEDNFARPAESRDLGDILVHILRSRSQSLSPN